MTAKFAKQLPAASLQSLMVKRRPDGREQIRRIAWFEKESIHLTFVDGAHRSLERRLPRQNDPDGLREAHAHGSKKFGARLLRRALIEGRSDELIDAFEAASRCAKEPAPGGSAFSGAADAA